ncbi:hypothetical protein FACS1894132_05820 [Clostridia bacterium]|nr:hypothetical protein FACS1894132_05820 [Clostridia bacterium]
MKNNSVLIKKDLLEIAGNTQYAKVRIKRDGKTIRFQKAYKVKIFLHRHDNSVAIAVADGIYNVDKNCFDVKFSSTKTDDLYGNYFYQIEVITPTGQKIRKWCGYQHEIPYIED